jgi:hypothetical protein
MSVIAQILKLRIYILKMSCKISKAEQLNNEVISEFMEVSFIVNKLF